MQGDVRNDGDSDLIYLEHTKFYLGVSGALMDPPPDSPRNRCKDCIYVDQLQDILILDHLRVKVFKQVLHALD